MREIIFDLSRWEQVQMEHWGKQFAFDFETTGLSFRRDQVCGLAITFETGHSYYLCFQHTRPEEQRQKITTLVPVLTGYKEEEYFTPKKQIRKVKQVPIYEQVSQSHDELITAYPTAQYLDPKEAAYLLNYLFAQDVTMVAHNAKFDLHFLEVIGIDIKGKLVDTMLAAKLIDENRFVGLKELAPLVYMDLSSYQNLEHYPGFGKEEFLGVPLDAAARYAMMDTEATWKLWKLFKGELVSEGVADAFYQIWMPAMRVLQTMEHKGIAVDLDKVRALREHYSAELVLHDRIIMETGLKMVNATFTPENVPLNYVRMLTPIETERYDALSEPQGTIQTDDGFDTLAFRPTPRSAPRAFTFNPGSNDHLARLFYDYLGLTPPEGVKIASTNGGRPVDKNMLKMWQLDLADECPPIIEHIQKRRQAEKFIGTYLDRMIADADPDDHNCIRANFNQHITDTGRLSSSNPNLQNIPSREQRGKEARDLFVARPGYQLIVADYSAMELVIASHYAAEIDPEHTMLTAIRDGKDLHTLTASRQFNMDYDELVERLQNKDDIEAKLRRQIGKTSNFGLLYGMGAKKFQVYLWTEVGIFLPLKEVQRLIDLFNDTYWAVTKWKTKVENEVSTYGYVTTMGGRLRRLPGVFSNDRMEVMRALRQAVNAMVQGSCADIVQAAMPWIQEELEKIEGYLLLQVHDELVGEVAQGYVEQGMRILQRGMVEHINSALALPLNATAHSGYSWGSAKG